MGANQFVKIYCKFTFHLLQYFPSVFPATISVASVVKNDQAEKLKLEMEK